ncbi:MAG: hypothetical protein AAGA27_02110 [Pseudomonadota bacterium]
MAIRSKKNYTAVPEDELSTIAQKLETIEQRQRDTSSDQADQLDMTVPDTHRLLKTKRPLNFIERLLSRLINMFSPQPIIGNIIALLIALGALYYVFNFLQTTSLARYHDYFAIGIQLFAALQIIKSGTRSLLLPAIAVIVGVIAYQQLQVGQLLFAFDRDFYLHLSVVGIIGLAASMLSIT